MDPRRLFLLVCTVLLGGAGGLFAQDDAAPAPELFERTADAAVHVRHETLALTPGRSVRLNVLPDAVSREGVITSAADTASGSRVLRGRIKDSSGGSFLVATHGTATAASVWVSPSERYTLDGNGLLRRELPGSQVRCACAADPAPAVRPERAAPRPTIQSVAVSSGPSEFDVLVVYTPAALAAEGGTADAVTAQAELALADANTCYQNSGIPIHGNLVGVQPVNYTESGEIRTDLHRLAVPGDGFLDEVQTMRDAARADLVCMFTDKASADGYNGFAEILTVLRPDGEVLGFSVVNVKQATVDHLFAHELGHNMGCDHDRENTTGLRLFPFSYGWRFTGTDGHEYRDVMAYPPGDSVGIFSSPLVSYAGTPTGVADHADTARTITESAPLFTNFRPADGLEQVSVRAATAEASVTDRGDAQASFKFERTGSTVAPLTVAYAIGGTAVAGDSYRALPGSFTFDAGQHFVVLPVKGHRHPNPFGAGTVALTLQPGEGYAPTADLVRTAFGTSAAVTLYDRLPLVSLGAARHKMGNAKVRFTVSRLGRTDAALTVPYTLGGTAVAGVDYRVPAGAVTFAPGQDKVVLKIKLLVDHGRTLTVSLTATPGVCNVAAPGTVDFTW